MKSRNKTRFSSLKTTAERTKDMDLTFGHLKAGENPEAKADNVGKSLTSPSKFKKTRFKLDQEGIKLPNKAMESWIDSALKNDKDVKKTLEIHKFSKEDMRKACIKFGLTRT